MTPRFFKTVTLLACALCSTMALAEPPTLVGRVSLVQGQVGIRSDVGDGAGAAQLNWPVTSHNQITTGRGARTEIRIGSSAIRLDADSSLEVSELDDDSLHLYLNHGSASVRIVNPGVLPGFVLSTPNGRIRLQQPGRLRVDAERASTVLTVFDGVALADDRGSQLIVRAGKRAEIGDDDVRTGVALRDSFDDWAQLRDQLDERSTSARYVTREMTGYEALDQNGVWRDDAEYGPLWLPSAVGAGWAPYRDGSWTWIAPWGWTWVDNAPWGYAPFHYGRWVQVDQRWAWAPGRQVGRPVWAPALVGWVGGAGWSQNFAGRGGQRVLPAQGWYPLAPRDAFVPGYRLSQDHLQRINRDARPDGRGDGRGDGGRRDGRGEQARNGLTVVPHAQFGQRGTIAVRNAPQAEVPPLALRNAPAAAPSAPQGAGRDRDGRAERDGQPDRFDRDAVQRNRQQRPELNFVPAPAFRPPLMNPAITSGQPQAPAPSPSPFSRRDGRPGFDDGDRRQQQAPVQGAVMSAPTVPSAPAAAPAPAATPPQFGRRDGRPAFEERTLRQSAPVAAPPAMAAPMTPPVIAPPPAAEPPQPGRAMRNDGERRMREPDAGAAMPAQPPRQFAPAPVFHQQPAPVFQQQPAPAPVFQQQPAPVMMRQAPLATPAPMPAPAPPMMVRQPPPAAAQQPPPAAQQGAPSERKSNPNVERKRAIESER